MAAIKKADAEALLNKQDINEILQDAPKASMALSSFRTIRMSAGTAKMPVLAALPTAGFVTDDIDADTSTKPTSQVKWGKKELIVEEIAVIVPIHENTFDDSAFNIWNEVRPLIGQKFGRVLDGAVFFGINKPTTWDQAIVPGAVAAGNVAYEGTVDGDLAEDINQTWALVEADGFDVNANYTSRALRARLRGLRDTTGQPIYLDSLRSDQGTASIYGEPLHYATNGAWDAAAATLVAGDRTKAVIGIRQDMQFKILDQATVGGYNLAEKDMIALRCKMRVAYAVAAPYTLEGGANAYPFAVLKPGTAA